MVLFAVLVVAGCGSDPVANPSVQVPQTRTSVVAADPVDGPKLVLADARTLTYDSSAHTEPEVTVQENRPAAGAAERSWWVRYYKGTPGNGAVAEREVKLTLEPNGDIAESEEIDRTDKVEVVYVPALVVIPHNLAPGNAASPAYVQDVKMVVHPLGDRSKVRTHGPAKSEITYTGNEQLKTPAGEFTARKLTTVLTANLSASHTVNTSEQWWADGVGLVCEKDHEVTKVLGAKVRDNSTTLLLKSYEKAH